MVNKILGLILILFSVSVSAETKPCQFLLKEPTTYESELRGSVSIYANDSIIPSVTDFSCLIGAQFFEKIGQFPRRATLALINEPQNSGIIAQWDLDRDYVLLTEVKGTEGTFIKYPKPLSRLKEIIIGSRLPSREELPITDRKKFVASVLSVKPGQIHKLVDNQE